MTAADPGALGRAVASGEPLHELRAAAAVAADHRDRVRARCGQRAVVADGLEELLHVAAHAVESDQLVSTIRAAVVAADTAPWPGPTNGGPPSAPRGLRVVDRGVAAGLTGGSGVPWLDPDTDSWVVGLGRALSGGRPAPAFIRRVLDDGPAFLAAVTDPELSLPQQAVTLLTDPGRFVADWRRAGVGAIDATRALGLAAFGVASVITPGADDTAERLVGRRFGRETQQAIIAGAGQLLTDPDVAAQAALGFDTYRQDPYRWFGSMLPDVLLEAAATALPVTAVRRARLLGPPPEPAPPAGLVSPPPPAGLPPLGSPSPPPPPSPLPDLDAVRRLEPEWGPVPAITSHRQAAFEPPETWVADLNGDGHSAPGRNNNCVDCARAAEANWRGQDAVAAPLADTHRTGVSVDRIEEWAGGRLVPATLDEIADELTELGPGSSAIVASGWDAGGAHAYNAVNDGGVVKWVDAQLGRTATWPPPYADDVDVSLVLYLDPDGRPR